MKSITAFRRRVSFSSTSEMIFVTNLALGRDKHMMWFTQGEIDAFKANRLSDVKLIIAHSHREPRSATHSSVVNTVGVEKFLTSKIAEEYKFRRRKLTKAVLRESRRSQSQRQRREGLDAREDVSEDDVDRLARVSAENSKWARERARSQALCLEGDVS